MYSVYVLEFVSGGWYIGMTGDLKRRMYEHKAGKNTSTSYRGDFGLIYFEAYVNKFDALGREKFLKSGAGRRFLCKQLRNHLAEKQ